jgi:hypothetical protein
MSMKTRLSFRRFLRHTGGLASEREGTILNAVGDIRNQLCFLVRLRDWRSASVVLDFAHCLGTNAMNNSIIDIEKIPHLSIAPDILKLIARDREEGENLGTASGSGIVRQAAKNESCITGRQLLGEAGISEIQGSWRSAWVDLGAIAWFWRAPLTADRRYALCGGYTLCGPSIDQKRAQCIPPCIITPPHPNCHYMDRQFPI